MDEETSCLEALGNTRMWRPKQHKREVVIFGPLHSSLVPASLVQTVVGLHIFKDGLEQKPGHRCWLTKLPKRHCKTEVCDCLLEAPRDKATCYWKPSVPNKLVVASTRATARMSCLAKARGPCTIGMLHRLRTSNLYVIMSSPKTPTSSPSVMHGLFQGAVGRTAGPV